MIKLISWIGTATSIIGSFLVAMHYFQLGYIFFLVGSASWLYVAFREYNKPLGLLNATFFTANIVGIINSF